MAARRTKHTPAHRWTPKFYRTDGDIAAGVGAQLGMPPDPEQRMILDAIYATRRDGTPECFEVAAIAPRQNLKTATLEIAALTDLYVDHEPLHIWTAHKFDTAQKTFRHMKLLIESNEDFRSRTRFHNGNGDEAIELLPGGQLIEFHARSKGAGRGATGAKITLDEALYLTPGDMGSLLPTLATVPTAQVRYGSSAGLVTSAVLRGIRDRGRKGGDPSLAYFEWCARQADCKQDFCHHFLGTPGCALDNMVLLRQANPALGRRISEERLAQFRRSMPPEEFMREFLGWWDDPPAGDGGALDAAAWEACLDRASKFAPGPAGLGVHLTGDRSTAYVGGIGSRADGLVHAELLRECRPSDVVDELRVLARMWRLPVVLDPGSHTGSLVQPLEDAGVTVEQITLQKLSAACGAVFDLVAEKQLRHIGQAQLDASALGSSRRVLSRDAWVWRGTPATPLIAVTLAAHGMAQGTAGKPFNIW